MADVTAAIEFVIPLEDDHKYPGCITQLRGDAGGRTRLGCAERFHPELSAIGFYDGDPIEGSTNPLRWTPTTVNAKDGMDHAVEAYQASYADPMRILAIKNQEIANRLLSFGVNEGVTEAVKIAQRVAGVQDDGKMGPVSIAAINGTDPAAFISGLKAAQVSFYKSLAASNPNLAGYLQGLINRANA